MNNILLSLDLVAAYTLVVGPWTNQTAALLIRRVFRRSPFAPRALPRFIATMGLSDSRRRPRSRLLIPLTACRLARHQGGSPKFPIVLSARAVSSHPGESHRCFRSFLPGGCWLHEIRVAGHSHRCVTRLNRVRFRYGSRVRLPRLRRRDYSCSPLGRLPVQRSIHMADSFHSARTAQLYLAHRINTNLGNKGVNFQNWPRCPHRGH